MMNFINLAHCSFAMLGGYVTVALMTRYGWPFFATLPCAFIAAAVVSVGFERLFYRRLYRASDLDQVLLTIGIVFISIAVAAYMFGTEQKPLPLQEYLRSSITFLGLRFAVYRLIMIAIALVITLLLVLTVEYTRFGAKVRAAVDNERMARGLGIDVPGLCFDRGVGRRPRLYLGLFRRRGAARHQRRRRQILCARHRRLSHLSGDDRASDVAAARPVRETLSDGVDPEF